MMKKGMKLDNLQLKIMQILWKMNEASAQDVQYQLSGERDFAITTIGTILSRLHRKGFLTYRKKGRQFIYRPTVTEDEAKTTLISRMTRQLFDGKRSALVNHLIRSGDLKDEELIELRNLIDHNLSEKESQP